MGMTTNRDAYKTTATSMKSVLITGASSGIGAALAKYYLKQGWRVFACGRNDEALAEIDGAESVIFDITKVQQIKEAATYIQQALGGQPLDLAILNAGNCEYIDNANQFDGALFERVIRTNLIATGYCIEAFIPLLRASSRLALMGSSVVYLPLPRAEAYGASKAGVQYLADSLRLDLAASDIGVSLICPGFVKTPLTDKNDFAMPMQISATEAAEYIATGLSKKDNEIHFPLRFTLLLKLLSNLPQSLMMWLMKRSTGKSQGSLV